MNLDSPWLTKKQAGQYCQVSERTIDEWIRDGLRCSKIGRTVRIHITWIDSYLEAFSEESRADAIVQEIAREMGKR